MFRTGILLQTEALPARLLLPALFHTAALFQTATLQTPLLTLFQPPSELDHFHLYTFAHFRHSIITQTQSICELSNYIHIIQYAYMQ